MKDRVFIDTNLWIYLFSKSELLEDIRKKKSVVSLLQKSTDIVISAQVLSEMSSVFLRKMKFPVDRVRSIMFEMGESVDIIPIDESHVSYALDIVERYQLSWYDSLIAASAISAQVEILYSEDMQHEMMVDNSLKIINPFLL
ncbi:MAG TPA: PIN domain-containing protein [Spirochaetota bacterium]|nr:PIN domain-containing protein [Spirochaetota bacterium]HPJ44319.1 PIN domain-containing protein [Spirochaetota bacterium]HPR39370.1 PIN domain-containing protein [Spirochaetota bacterium]HRX49502.1 PIN domain-containing protein [Spirochaetota bacterium]